MDINESLKDIAQGLIDNLKVNLEAELQQTITNEVIERMALLELNSLIATTVQTELNKKLVSYDLYDLSTKELGRVITATVDYINKSLIQSAKNQIVAQIDTSISQMNILEIVNLAVKTHLQTLLESASFANNSIPHEAVNFSGIKFTGDAICGGIIESFGSTGIEDRASFVQLTLMDHATVFEGPVYSPALNSTGNGTIDGTLTVKGDLVVLGEIPEDCPAFKTLVERSVLKTQEVLKESLNDQWFSNYSKIIFDEIKETGLDLNKITQNNREIVDNNRLGYHITDTNIQRLGHVLDLQTRGETLLSDTLYVTQNRAGVNTLDPSAAFVVWDEECELIVTKRKQDTGYIGTSRNQTVILGSHNKENIILDPAGGVTVQNLTVGKVHLTSGLMMPNYDAPLGQIVFNETPTVGNFIGWVSLGGARWASFGKIE